MSLFECIEATLWRWRYQWAKYRADVRLAKRDRERSRDFCRRGVLVLALVCCPSLHACVVREIRAEQARCFAELDAAQTVADVDATLARCHARLEEINR